MPDFDFFHGIEYVLLSDEAPPVRTLKSSIIGLVGTAGKGAINTPVAITGGRREAVRLFGEFHKDGFTIPEALDAIFDQGGATVVVVNVNDRTTHVTEIEDEAITFDRFTGIAKTVKPFHTEAALTGGGYANVTLIQGKYQLPTGLTVSAIKSSDGETTYVAYVDAEHPNDYKITNGLIERQEDGDIPADNSTIRVVYTLAGGFTLNTDFTYDAEKGEYQRLSTGSKIVPGSVILCAYTYVDPTKVTDVDVIGAVTDGDATGIEALGRASASVKLKPRLLCAPRFTQVFSPTEANGVADALDQMSRVLGGRAVVDAPNTDKGTAVDYASFFSGPTRRTYIHFPNLRVQDPDEDGWIAQPASARIVGLISKTDNEAGFWHSPSNRELAGVLGIDKALTWGLSDKDTDVEYLNDHGVATTIFEQGFRLWGNRMANLEFLSTHRISDIINESIVVSHMWAVDRNITRGLVESVVEGVRAYLRRLETLGALIPNPNPSKYNDAWADPDLNTPEAVADGNLYIDYRYNPPPPAEHITFRAHMTRDYIVGIFAQS